MFNWRILIISIVLMVICAAQDVEISQRPIRPEKFVSHQEFQDYLQHLKAFYLKNGQRYGKRFSPPKTAKIHPQFLPENWRDIYEIVKQYEEN